MSDSTFSASSNTGAKWFLIMIGVVALVVFLLIFPTFFSQLVVRTHRGPQSAGNCSQTSPCTESGPISYRYLIDMTVVDHYGTWVAGSETPSSILQIIGSIRSSVSNQPVNIFDSVRNIQNNDETLDHTSTTLNSYLLQVKQAAGGDIIPELDLDVYNNVNGDYCDPQNPSFCGPAFFYATSQELLSLSAVQEGSKTVLLDSWPTFYRTEAVSVQSAVLQNLTRQGWQHIIIKQIGPNFYSPPGYTWGQVTTPWKNTSSTPPYMQPQTDILNLMPSNQQRFLYFDRQDKLTPTQATALQVFLTQLDSSQQAAALTNFANLQPSYQYTFDYPIITYTTYQGVTYSWDASTAMQSNGQTFLQLIEHLMSTTAP